MVLIFNLINGHHEIILLCYWSVLSAERVHVNYISIPAGSGCFMNVNTLAPHTTYMLNAIAADTLNFETCRAPNIIDGVRIVFGALLVICLNCGRIMNCQT